MAKKKPKPKPKTKKAKKAKAAPAAKPAKTLAEKPARSRGGRKPKYGVATAELVYEFFREGLGPDRIAARLREINGHGKIDKKTVRAIIKRNEEDWEERKKEDLSALATEKRRLYVSLYSSIGEKLVETAKALVDKVQTALEQN